MDINLLRSVMTIAFFAIFLGIFVWAYSKKNRQQFEDAAAVPFMDDDGASKKIGETRE